MNARILEENEKMRNDLAKRAVAFAMRSRWEDAEKANRAILRRFPNDVEAYNRLGKALSELGRNREARTAFQAVIDRSRNNAIAKKNLARLAKLDDGDDEARRAEADGDGGESAKTPPRSGLGVRFLAESGKAGVTALTKLGAPATLRKLTPGDLVRLETGGGGLTVTDEFQEYVGQVEPRVGSRIARLMRGGNRYEATVTSAEDREMIVIIRETYKSPSQARVVSFPSRAGGSGGGGYRVYVATPPALRGDEDSSPAIKAAAVKDWSDDDTEPGDDDVFDDSLASRYNIIDADDDEF